MHWLDTNFKNGWVYNDMPLKAAVHDNEIYQDLGIALFSETHFDRICVYGKNDN